jgi:hypothetical protein
MKTFSVVIGLAIFSMLLGCSTAPVVLSPVGPNPYGEERKPGNGQLEVFSAMVGRVEGNNPTWYQHTGYYLCDLAGKDLKHVDNTVGRYAESPRVISLPPGRYLVKAHAQGYLWAEVPVVIESGRITKVHLDGHWRPSPETQKTEIVSTAAGEAVGWRIYIPQ